MALNETSSVLNGQFGKFIEKCGEDECVISILGYAIVYIWLGLFIYFSVAAVVAVLVQTVVIICKLAFDSPREKTVGRPHHPIVRERV